MAAQEIPPFSVRNLLLEHQTAHFEAMLRILDRPLHFALDTSSTGSGKTATSLLLAAELKCMRTLVLCPSQVAHKWRAEVDKILGPLPSGIRPHILVVPFSLLTRTATKRGMIQYVEEKTPRTDGDESPPEKKTPRRGRWACSLGDELSAFLSVASDGGRVMLIVDETQRTKNETSQTSSAVLQIMFHARRGEEGAGLRDHVYACHLSATPMDNILQIPNMVSMALSFDPCLPGGGADSTAMEARARDTRAILASVEGHGTAWECTTMCMRAAGIEEGDTHRTIADAVDLIYEDRTWLSMLSGAGLPFPAVPNPIGVAEVLVSVVARPLCAITGTTRVNPRLLMVPGVKRDDSVPVQLVTRLLPGVMHGMSMPSAGRRRFVRDVFLIDEHADVALEAWSDIVMYTRMCPLRERSAMLAPLTGPPPGCAVIHGGEGVAFRQLVTMLYSDEDTLDTWRLGMSQPIDAWSETVRQSSSRLQRLRDSGACAFSQSEEQKTLDSAQAVLAMCISARSVASSSPTASGTPSCGDGCGSVDEEDEAATPVSAASASAGKTRKRGRKTPPAKESPSNMSAGFHQEVEMIKARALVRLIRKQLAENDDTKFVVMCNFVASARAIAGELAEESVLIDGAVAHKDRREALRKFMDDSDETARVLSCTMWTMGTGTDIHAQGTRPYVMYIMASHNAIAMTQAGGRTFRAGVCFDAPVFVVYGSAQKDDTRDRDIIQRLSSKGATIRFVGSASDAELLPSTSRPSVHGAETLQVVCSRLMAGGDDSDLLSKALVSTPGGTDADQFQRRQDVWARREAAVRLIPFVRHCVDNLDAAHRSQDRTQRIKAFLRSVRVLSRSELEQRAHIRFGSSQTVTDLFGCMVNATPHVWRCTRQEGIGGWAPYIFTRADDGCDLWKSLMRTLDDGPGPHARDLPFRDDGAY